MMREAVSFEEGGGGGGLEVEQEGGGGGARRGRELVNHCKNDLKRRGLKGSRLASSEHKLLVL